MTSPKASESTWIVDRTPASAAPAAAPTPEQIVTELTPASPDPAAPADPAPSRATAAPAATPATDTDAGRRLAEAQADLDQTTSDLATARSALDAASEDAQVIRLTRIVTTLTAKKELLVRRVDQLTQEAERAQQAAAAEAAKAAPLTQPSVDVPGYRGNPYLNTPGTQVTLPVAPSAVPGDLAASLDAFLASKGSPLAGLGSTFVAQGQAVGLDPRLLVAIAGAETSFGTYGPSQAIHNPFGLGPGLVYPTWADAIAAAARNLAGANYLGAGRVTISQIQPVWAPNGAANDPTNLNSEWARNVSTFYAALGANPAGRVFGERAGGGGEAIPVAPGVASGIEATLAAPVAYGPGTPVSGGGSGVGEAAVRDALRFLGTPYLWGGTSPRGFDCSGLVQYVYRLHGVELPRVAEDQAAVGTPIAPSQLRPGDAVFFADSTGYIHHEGMYVGNGLFVHAPHTGDVVKVSSLYEPYYARQYAGARRY